MARQPATRRPSTAGAARRAGTFFPKARVFRRMTVSKADIDAFRTHVEGRELTNPDTITDYLRWIRRFEAWRPGGEPDEAMVRRFDSFLHDDSIRDYPWDNLRGRAPPPSYSFQSRIKALSALKHWLPYAYDTAIPTEVQKLAYGEPAPFDPDILPPHEIDQIVNEADIACDNPDCRAAISVGYDAIMRGIEITRVRREDVNHENHSVFVRAAKGSNRVTVGLGPNAWYELKRHLRNNPDREGPLFYNAYGRPWKPDAWSKHFRTQHHVVGWHAVGRHSAITNRLRAGDDFGSVYQRARHQNPTMTTRYARIVDADVPEWVSSGASPPE